jgi:hypothetical protein
MKTQEQAVKQPKSPSKLIGIPTYLFGILSTLFLSIVISIIIEWIGIFFNYWDLPGHLHAKDIFTKELSWVLGDSLSSMQSVANFYTDAFTQINHYAIQKSGIEQLALGELSLSMFWILIISVFFSYLANWTHFRDDFIMSFFLNILAILPILFLISVAIDIILGFNVLKEYIFAMVYIIQLTIIRVLTILFSFPAFLLITLYVIADGLYQRQIRKLSGAMESSFIYHHTKRWIKPLIAAPMVLLLASPFAIHPSVFVLVATLTPGFFILTTVKYFKKYL